MYRSLRIASLVAIVSLATLTAVSASAQDEWQLFPRPSFPHEVEAATLHDGQLVVGGWFTSIHDLDARHVARWNGTKWEALGAGAAERVTALTTYGGTLYNGNAYDEGHVAWFDGLEWNRVGTFQFSSGFARIDAMIEFGGLLLVGGRFDQVDGEAFNGFAAWDGTAWSKLGSGPAGPGQRVTALGTWQGDLVAAGDFTVAGGGAADGIARWTGTDWVAVGTGLPEPAETLIEFDGQLWAGFVAWVEGTEVRRFDGQDWLVAGDGVVDLTGYFSTFERRVLDLQVFDGELYLGGNFSTGYTSPGSMAGRWNGTSWEVFGGFTAQAADFAPSWTVNVLLPWNDLLVLAGLFPSTAGEPIENLAAWNGSGFKHVTEDELGLDSYAYDFALAPDGVVVGGRFDEAGVLATGPVARWDGQAWQAYGLAPADRIDGTVNAVLVDGTGLVVGGSLTLPDATTSSAARFDGSSWTALGGGSDPSVSDLVHFDGSIVAGTWDRVRTWNGTAWEVLGSGIPADVWIAALAVYEDKLHAAGSFDPSGYPSVAVFRLDGSTWTSLAPAGTHSSGRARALAVHDGTLLVGGDMGGVGELASPGLVAWDGTGWSARLGSIESTVRALASTSQGLVIGGSFRNLNGDAAIDGFALDDPVEGWTAIAGAPTSGVYALLPVDDSLWLGGSFRATVDGSSPGVIVWHPDVTTGRVPFVSRGRRVQVVPNPFNPRTTLRFETAAPGRVDVEIFDQAGRRVRTLRSGTWYEAGRHDVVWDGRDDGGSLVASGVYFVRVDGEGGPSFGKMALVR